MPSKVAVRNREAGKPAPRRGSAVAQRGTANTALLGVLDNPGTLPVPVAQRLADLAGNQALAGLLGRPAVVQRLKSISEVVPPGERATPTQALTRYISYLKGESYKYEDKAWMAAELDSLRDEILGAGELSIPKIQGFRRTIDGYAGQLQAAEDKAKPAAKPDSDIVEEYKPLKACVLQSLEQFGILGMTAAAYHAKLWKDNDPLKYYDMDTKIGEIYQRFGLVEKDAEGLTYAQLTGSLKVGKYVVNVTSPAGPNGHMFALIVEAPSQKNKPNKAFDRQDPANRQSWQPSDKILRYWVKA